MHHWIWSALVQVMACRLVSTKPLPEPMLAYCQSGPLKEILVKFESIYKTFNWWKCIWECRLWNVSHFVQGEMSLTHWGRMTYICVSKQTIIGSDNGLSPGRRQAIIWTNAGILLMGTLGTNFSEILILILTYFHSIKWVWMCRLRNGGHFVMASRC